MFDTAAAATATLSLIHSCNTVRDLHQVHAHIIKNHHHHHHSHLAGRLVAAACSLRQTHYALSIFSLIPHPDTFTHNSLINAHLRSSSPHLALLFFISSSSSFTPNSHTFPLLLKSAALLHSPLTGATLHSLFLKLALPLTPHTLTALLSLYSSSPSLPPAAALRLLSSSPNPPIAAWNALISGFLASDRPNLSLSLFRRLLLDPTHPAPDEATLSTALAACAALGALAAVEWIHSRSGKIPSSSLRVGTALVDAYAKCGSLELARAAFDEMPRRSVVTYTAMIRALAMLGPGQHALALFEEMLEEGIAPDGVALVAVLSACSHSGLVRTARRIFNTMEELYGISPKREHYGCMVDLFSRAGFLHDALAMIETMPFDPDPAHWGSLLSACRRDPANLELAELVANRLVELEPENDATYVLLSSIYARNGKWASAASIRASMKDIGVRKTPGCSSVEVGGVVHEFTVGDRSHPRMDEIGAMMEEIESRIVRIGYVMDTSEVALDVDEEEKRRALMMHSEKLALAFGLIDGRTTAPVRIVKNIRVCDDCHVVMKLASKAFGREIVLRDRNRFHRFRDGSCTCDDFW